MLGWLAVSQTGSPASKQQNVNTQVQRLFKINGRYGEAIGQDNGFGQGDPFALLIALV